MIRVERIVATLALWLCMLTAAMAQDLEVKDFSLTGDILSENDYRKDARGVYCALVKVRTTYPIDHVEGDVVGEPIDRGSEKWIHLKAGTQEFTLYIKGWSIDINCKDYGIGSLGSKQVYALTFEGNMQEVKYLALTDDKIGEKDWQKDLSNDYCALVKVRTADVIEKVEGNIVGKPIDRGSEKWLFMTAGTRKFRLHIKGSVPIDVNCNDFRIDKLVGKRVYALAFKEMRVKGNERVPLYYSDSKMVKTNDEWYKLSFDAYLPYMSALLQTDISKALFGSDDESLEMAYNNYLKSYDEIKPIKRENSYYKNYIDCYVECTFKKGPYVNINAIYSKGKTEKGELYVTEREYMYLYDTKQDWILTYSDVFVPTTVYDIENKLGSDRIGQMVLNEDSVMVRVYLKGTHGLPDGECIETYTYKIDDNLSILNEEFLANIRTSSDVFLEAAKEKMKLYDKQMIEKNSMQIFVIQNGEVTVDDKEKGNAKRLYEAVSTLPKFPALEHGTFAHFMTDPIQFTEDEFDKLIQVAFDVHPDGSVTNQRVVESPSETLSGKLQKVLDRMPLWTQGANNGVDYRVVDTVTIVVQQAERKLVYDDVEKMPSFIGGDEALDEWIAQNIRYPKDAVKKRIQGTVVCTFVVEVDGSITDPKVVISVDPSIDKEAIRLLNKMPKWKAGVQSGSVVRVKTQITFTFELQDPE